MEEEYLGVVAIVGDEWTCKSSMALSSVVLSDNPVFHFEIDFGGFDRAAWYLKKNHPELRIKRFAADEDLSQTNFQEYDILTKPYPKPLQVNKLMGQLTSNTASVRQIQQPKKIEGMKELWQTLVTDLVYVCNTTVSSIIFDSATALWNIDHNARLQELQEIQAYKWANDHKNNPQIPENEYRERLQPIEYGQPNDRMTTLLNTCRSFRKNVILTHYPADEYGMVADGKGGLTEGKTGKSVIDGFKHTRKLCDLIVWLHLASKSEGGKTIQYPVAKIDKCGIAGMGLDAKGIEIAATFEDFINRRNLMRGSTNA